MDAKYSGPESADAASDAECSSPEEVGESSAGTCDKEANVACPGHLVPMWLTVFGTQALLCSYVV